MLARNRESEKYSTYISQITGFPSKKVDDSAFEANPYGAFRIRKRRRRTKSKGYDRWKCASTIPTPQDTGTAPATTGGFATIARPAKVPAFIASSAPAALSPNLKK